MTTLQALIDDFNKSVEVIKRERKLQAQILREITDRFCEHKVGQKATINRSGRIVTIVCKYIDPDIFNGKVLFSYKFKQLKKDGTLSRNEIYVYNSEINWLDEYIQI